MTRMTRTALILTTALLMAEPAHADTYSWRGMIETLEGIARSFDRASVGDAPAIEPYGQDLRPICQDSLEQFVAKVAAQGCRDGACGRRPMALARQVRALAGELSNSIQGPDALTNSNAALFLPSGLTLTSSPEGGENELRLRAAHDLWLRGWMDPLAASSSPADRDRRLVLSRLWCGMTRDNAIAAAGYLDHHGFSPPAIAPAVVNIAIHATWDPGLSRRLYVQAEVAFERGDLAGYYAGQLVDIDAMASTETQRLGTLFSCADGRAFPDPPLADPASADRLRHRYGYGPLAAAITARSRTCATD